MSIQAVAWVLEQDIPDQGAKLVLISIANAMNSKTGKCCPAVSQIMIEASCSESTVRRKIKWLCENGWLEATHCADENGRKTANDYGINMGERVGVSLTGAGVTCDGGVGVNCDTPLKEPEEGTYTPSLRSGAEEIDFAKAIFSNGVEFLIRHGTPERQARTLIGKWRKKHPDEQIFQAFASASRAGAVEPISYITKILVGGEDERLKAWGISDGVGNTEPGGDTGSDDEWDTKIDLSPMQSQPEAPEPPGEVLERHVPARRDSLVLSSLHV